MKQSNNQWKSIKKVDPLSLAKIQAVVVGLLYLIFSILSVILSSVPALKLQIPLNPLLYISSATATGIIAGFLLGLIIAFLYNSLSKHIGQIKIELE